MTGFDQIYRMYFTDVYRFLLGLTKGDAPLAEELTSETFFRAMGAIDHFRGDCEIRVWLCQIAKHCYFSHLRGEGRTQSLDREALEQAPDLDASPEEQVIGRDTADAVRREVHRLPEPYREVFLWRVLGQLGFREIGKLYGKTANWACVTYHRARMKILEGMGEKNGK